jgi:hypothetical protein
MEVREILQVTRLHLSARIAMIVPHFAGFDLVLPVHRLERRGVALGERNQRRSRHRGALFG